MPALFLKLIPFRDYAYAAIAIAAVIFYNVHVHQLEVHYAADKVEAVHVADANATERTLRAAKSALDEKEKQYTLQLSQVEDNYETQLKSADAQHSADLDRVRQLTAASHRNGGAVLPSTGSSNAATDGRSASDRILGAAVELADALRRDDAALALCYAERDSLTGK